MVKMVYRLPRKLGDLSSNHSTDKQQQQKPKLTVNIMLKVEKCIPLKTGVKK
jgi:hypothetical protein